MSPAFMAPSIPSNRERVGDGRIPQRGRVYAVNLEIVDAQMPLRGRMIRPMCRLIFVVALMASSLLVCAAPTYADAGLLRTVQALDEPRGYCQDIRGEGPTLGLDQPLQVHTCKYGAALDDQRFERTADGAIRASAYNRCLAAASLAAGAQLVLQPCGNAPTQRWSMAWGRLSPASRSDLCVTVAGE
jgi:hypothetical protein